MIQTGYNEIKNHVCSLFKKRIFRNLSTVWRNKNLAFFDKKIYILVARVDLPLFTASSVYVGAERGLNVE